MYTENLVARGVTELRSVEARLTNFQRQFRELARFIVIVAGLQTSADDMT